MKRNQREECLLLFLLENTLLREKVKGPKEFSHKEDLWYSAEKDGWLRCRINGSLIATRLQDCVDCLHLANKMAEHTVQCSNESHVQL